MTHRFTHLLIAAALLASATGTVLAAPPPASLISKAPDEMVPDGLHLSGADIDSVLGALEQYTGRSILRTQQLPASTYTVSVRGPIPKSEIVLALETLLELNNVGVTPMGDRYLKVVPLNLLKSEAPELIEGSTLGLPPSGKVAAKLFQLKFLRVSEFFTPTLNPLFSTNIGGIGAGVVILEKANAAIVTDTVSNLQRFETLLVQLDRPAAAALTPKFYQLQFAQASDLVAKVKAILTGEVAKQVGSATSFNADDRTNQVILLADPRQIPFFDDLIGKLDVKSDPNTRNEVIYLKHADANTLVPILQQLVAGQNANTQKAGTQRRTDSSQGGFTGTAAPTGVQPGAAGNNAFAATAVNAAMQSVVGGSATGGQTAVFSGLVTILADERSNGVVISGTLDDIRLIKDLIAKLDVVLAQVRIEVIIAEVQLDDKDQSGLTALGLTFATDSTRGTHISNFTGSLPGWDVTSGVVNPLALQAALNTSSAGSSSKIHILQAPIIVTTHAKAAEVSVGEQYPVVTGGTTTPITSSTSASSGTSTTFTTSYQTIAVDLKVTPYIGDDGNVQLTIDQKVNDIGGFISVNGNEQPIITTREATSYVSVFDGQMIVLGGLQKTEKTNTHNKIGLLYEIPILSQLLGGHTDELQKDELLVFIRPHVIKPQETTQDANRTLDTLSNKDEVKRFLNNPSDTPNNKVKNVLDRFKDNTD